MQFGADHVRVTVPANSANLGPGFDSLGLALDWCDEIDVQAVASSEVTVDVLGEGAGVVPDDDTHLVVRALRVALDLVGAPQTGFKLTCVNKIPHTRGLGSSAAAVIAGILAARGLIAEPDALDNETVLRLATEFEGHPDNAAPALLGGATVAWMSERGEIHGARAVRMDPHRDIRVAALVPSARLATKQARGVLPEAVPHADAAFNAGRSALMVHALTQRPDLLLEATDDRLHQDYRALVMAGSAELVRTLRAQDLAAVISGAGPSVLVLYTEDDYAKLKGVLADLLAGSDWLVRRVGIAARGAEVSRVGRNARR